MRIGEYWMEDDSLLAISQCDQQTPFMQQLASNVWPQRYEGWVSSDTYRGCAVALSAIFTKASQCAEIAQMAPIIDAVDASLQTSSRFPRDSARFGGAKLSLTNAWEAANCGYNMQQLREAYLSEAIYAAGKFIAARGMEQGGAVLA